MVGIPRSNACSNCKARRKGCGGQRPSCGQCMKRGVECLGYRTEPNFVFVHPESKQSHSLPSRPRHDFRTTKSISSDTSPSTPSSTSLSTSSSPPTTPSDDALTAVSPQLLPLSFLETAYRSQIYGRFFETYLPLSSGTWTKLETDLNVERSTSWLYAAATVPPTDDLLNYALTALALALNERLEGKDPRFLESPMLYRKAMRKLALRLNDKEESFRDSTLAAVMALSLYEVSQIQGGTLTRANGWLSHVQGASTLIRLRGGRNFSTPFSRKLFLGSRLSELINAIGRRKAVPASATWSKFTPQSQLPSDVQLFEICQVLPAIIEQADLIVVKTTAALKDMMSSKTPKFVTMCQELESKLQDWYTDFSRQHSHTNSKGLFWPELSTLYLQVPPSSPSRIFSFFLCFPNLDIAEQVMLYWAGLLLMHRTIHLAERLLREHGLPPMNIFFPPRRSDSDDDSDLIPPLDECSLALNIATSLEYFVHPDMGLLEAQFIGFPLNLAYGYFASNGMKERLWFDVIRARMRDMATGHGDIVDEMVGRGGGVKGIRWLVP